MGQANRHGKGPKAKQKSGWKKQHDNGHRQKPGRMKGIKADGRKMER